MKPFLRIAAFFTAAVVLTWPLTLHLAAQLPLGTEGSATVPLFNLWTLRWNTDRLLHGYAGYWDAPIFFPTPGAFALSDPQPLTGLIFSPLYLLTGSATAAYNLVFLLVYTLNGWGGYGLARSLKISAFPAVLAGLLTAGLPFIAHENGVLQLTVVFPSALAIASLLRFSRTLRLRDAVEIGVWTAAAFLTSTYYGLFLLPSLCLGGVILLNRAVLARPASAGIAAAVVTAAVLLAPVLVPQARLTGGYSRLSGTIRSSSALPQDYLPDPLSSNGSGQPLYPGTALLLLGLTGAAFGWRYGARKEVVFLLVGLIFAGLLSLGLNLEIAGWQPYTWLQAAVPGYAQLRSPFRAAVLTQLFLAGLGGFTLRWLSRRPGRLGALMAAVLVLAALLENTGAPLRLTPAPQAAGWTAWLAGQPEAPIVMVPFPASGRTADFEPTVRGMLSALDAGKPLVNGYSGFFPAEYRSLTELMRPFPNGPVFDRLRLISPVYLVIDLNWLTAANHAERLAAEPGLRTIFEDDEVRIALLLPEPAEMPPN